MIPNDDYLDRIEKWLLAHGYELTDDGRMFFNGSMPDIHIPMPNSEVRQLRNQNYGRRHSDQVPVGSLGRIGVGLGLSEHDTKFLSDCGISLKGLS